MKVRLFTVVHTLSPEQVLSIAEKRKHDGTTITYRKRRVVKLVEAESILEAVRSTLETGQEMSDYPGVYSRYVSVYGAREAVEGEHPEPDEKLTHEELLLPL